MLLLMVLLSVGVYFLLSKNFPNVEINRYDSVETAKEQKAIENGFIPKNIPASAYDIVETHEENAQSVLGKFSYKEGDEASFLSGLTVSGEVYEGEGFLFKINKEKNMVDFRSKPSK